MNSRAVSTLFTLAVGAALGGAAVYWGPGLLGNPTSSTSDLPDRKTERPSAPVSQVVASGRLEPAGGVLTLTVPGGGRIEAFGEGVIEGARVKAAQVLVQLQGRAEREATLKVAEAQLKEAQDRKKMIRLQGEAQLDEAHKRLKIAEERQPREIELQEIKVKLLQAQSADAAHNLKRLRGLRKSSPLSVAEQQIEQQSLLARKTEAELATAESALKALREEHELILARAAVKTAEASLAKVLTDIPLESLERNVEAARLQVGLTELKAPTAGTILKIYAHRGETVGLQPVLQMADTRQMVVVAEVHQDQRRLVQPGQKAVVECKALGRNLDAVVERVGQMIARNTTPDVDPTKDADRRVIEVRLRLEQSDVAATFVNLVVTVRITVN
jgi:HlyD family secretion protein